MAKLIKYQLMTEVKNTYLDTDGKEKEEVTQIFSDVEIRCTEANFAANYAIAEKEAYGEITVEDDGQPDPAVPTNDDSAVWNELDKAYEEGYTEGYQEGVNTAYDE